MAADRRRDLGRNCASAYHLEGIGLGEGGIAQSLVPPLYRAEQWPLGLAAQLAPVETGSQIFLQIVVAGNFVALATLLMQLHTQATVLHEHVLHAYRQRRDDPD